MLLQSHLNEIHLLPALPGIWKEGQVKGLKARGNYTISINWKNHRLTSAVITPHASGICRIRTQNPVSVDKLKLKSKKDKDGYVLVFKGENGTAYMLTAL